MTYVIVSIFIILASITFIQNFLARLFGFSQVNIVFNIMYSIVLIGLFVLVKYLVDKWKENDEGFFFEVSNNQHCSGLYHGKPVSFQYSSIGSGDCKPIAYPSLGMTDNVHSCLHGNAVVYPQGVSYEHPGRVPSMSDDDINKTKVDFNTDMGTHVQIPEPDSVYYPYSDVASKL